jgi:hypothetical protein
MEWMDPVGVPFAAISHLITLSSFCLDRSAMAAQFTKYHMCAITPAVHGTAALSSP